MAYSLRLSPKLDAAARARAEFLGLSLNGLIAVALDHYLRSLPTEADADAALVRIAHAERGPKPPDTRKRPAPAPVFSVKDDLEGAQEALQRIPAKPGPAASRQERRAWERKYGKPATAGS